MQSVYHSAMQSYPIRTGRLKKVNLLGHVAHVAPDLITLSCLIVFLLSLASIFLSLGDTAGEAGGFELAPAAGVCATLLGLAAGALPGEDACGTSILDAGTSILGLSLPFLLPSEDEDEDEGLDADPDLSSILFGTRRGGDSVSQSEISLISLSACS